MQQLPDVFKDPLGFSSNNEAQEKFYREASVKRFDEIMNTARVFGTKDGKKELERLRAATIESSAWSPSLAAQSGIEAANAHAYAREGQNALVRDIENKIALSKKIKTPDDLFNLMTGENTNE